MQKTFGEMGFGSSPLLANPAAQSERHGANPLDRSMKHSKAGAEQGEIRIKFTDASKVSAERDPQ